MERKTAANFNGLGLVFSYYRITINHIGFNYCSRAIRTTVNNILPYIYSFISKTHFQTEGLVGAVCCSPWIKEEGIFDQGYQWQLLDCGIPTNSDCIGIY